MQIKYEISPFMQEIKGSFPKRVFLPNKDAFVPNPEKDLTFAGLHAGWMRMRNRRIKMSPTSFLTQEEQLDTTREVIGDKQLKRRLSPTSFLTQEEQLDTTREVIGDKQLGPGGATHWVGDPFVGIQRQKWEVRKEKYPDEKNPEAKKGKDEKAKGKDEKAKGKDKKTTTKEKEYYSVVYYF